jgi:hypothetical protein
MNFLRANRALGTIVCIVANQSGLTSKTTG